MDNVNINNPDNPVPLNPDSGQSIPVSDIESDEPGISHTPLDLGGSRAVGIPKREAPQQPVQRATPVAGSAEPLERITGVRTFFTKLHPGAVNFLDEQISDWLQKNPDIVIKKTNVVVGELQAKKTEPNILITVWY